MQFVLKACFLGYRRRTCSLFVPRGKSPDPLAESAACACTLTFPALHYNVRQEAIPWAAAELSGVLRGGRPSAFLVTQAVRASVRTNHTGLILSAADF